MSKFPVIPRLPTDDPTTSDNKAMAICECERAATHPRPQSGVVNMDDIVKIISDEWGSHICYRDSFGNRDCGQINSRLHCCRCFDIANSLVASFDIRPATQSTPSKK